MLNIQNYIMSLDYGFTYNKDNGMLIIPGVSYNALCDRFPFKWETKIMRSNFVDVDSFIHKITGADKFTFDNCGDTVWIWNEKKHEYE